LRRKDCRKVDRGGGEGIRAWCIYPKSGRLNVTWLIE
jgi:hypothetical protein